MRVFRGVKDLGDLDGALREAFEIKADRFKYQHLGRNRTALLIFFNNSLRTRLSTQKAAMNLGMNVIVLDVNQGAWPLQSFADLITIEEYKERKRPKVVMSWAPHPKALPQAVPNSFAEWMNAADVDFVVTHPEGYELDPRFVGGARVEYDQMKAFEGADFVYAKNWSCPGVTRPEDYGKVLNMDMDWTVGARQMAVTNNARFMHCLPVRRNMIVTDEVIEGPRSIVIPEAANREISATVVLKRMLESL